MLYRVPAVLLRQRDDSRDHGRADRASLSDGLIQHAQAGARRRRAEPAPGPGITPDLADMAEFAEMLVPSRLAIRPPETGLADSAVALAGYPTYNTETLR